LYYPRSLYSPRPINSAITMHFQTDLIWCDDTLKKVRMVRTNHRLDRVPGFLSSHPNRLPLPPHPLASVAPPPLGSKGRVTLARERGGGGIQFGRRDRHSGALGIVQSLYKGHTLSSDVILCILHIYCSFMSLNVKVVLNGDPWWPTSVQEEQKARCVHCTIRQLFLN
jgi:hypothetical protein